MRIDSFSSRRGFIKTGVMGSLGFTLPEINRPHLLQDGSLQQLPYKIGMRQASIPDPANASQKMVANFDTFKAARGLSGITGVELQVAHGNPNMKDAAVVRRYKAEAQKWGLMIPSTAGIWYGRPWGENAHAELLQGIKATSLLGAQVMLIAFFGQHAPDMNKEQSYASLVELLHKVAPVAIEEGVVLALENSLSPADNKKLVDIVARPNVQVYYDLDNMFQYGHGAATVTGIPLLGKERIAAVHVKNKGRLLADNWRIDWAAAFKALTTIAYEGWLVFETDHQDFEACVKDTAINIQFMQQHFYPPQV